MQSLANVTIETAEFTPLPVVGLVIIASWVMMKFVRWIQSRFNPQNGRAFDVAADAIALISAASVVAALTITPLISSLTQSLADVASNLSDSWELGVTAVILIILIVLAFFHFKTEGGWSLLLFALVLQAGAVFIPRINEPLMWYLNNVVSWVWNFFVKLFQIVLNLEVNF